ncbi:TPA: hypothetical protein DEG21_06000 [Patescibacteria group bacterium]|nr:hypothetical protein [Candidatus Gracilibacteria bacterium]
MSFVKSMVSSIFHHFKSSTGIVLYILPSLEIIILIIGLLASYLISTFLLICQIISSFVRFDEILIPALSLDHLSHGVSRSVPVK